MFDRNERYRLQWLRDLQRRTIPDWLGGILAGAALAMLLNLFP